MTMKIEPANDPIARTHLRSSRKIMVGIILFFIILGFIGMIAWLSGWAQAIPEGAEKAPAPTSESATP